MRTSIRRVGALPFVVILCVMCTSPSPQLEETGLGEPDVTEDGWLSVDETTVVATVSSGAVDIELPISRTTSSSSVSGTARATLLDLSGTELDTREVEVEMERGESTVTVTATGLQGVPEGTSVGDLARYVVRWEVELEGARVHGRRSLFSMARRLSTIVVGSDALYEGQPAHQIGRAHV